VVDRTVVAMATRGMKLEVNEEGLLTEEARRSVAEKVLERLDVAERYEKKRQPLRVILQSQARHIATFVRGDRAVYEPFIARW
jgi:CRISPR-associated protein Cas1